MPKRKVKITEINVKIAIEPDGKCFHAFAPALKGLHVEGATPGEALKNAKDAVDVYLDSLYRENEELPIGPYLSVKYEPLTPAVPAQLLRNVTIKWPTRKISGAR